MKSSINQLLSFYLNASFHVSFAVFALVQMTFYFCGLPFDGVVSLMAYTGTLFSYNFIKYANIIYAKRYQLSTKFKYIIGCSLVALVLGSVCFFLLNQKAQWITLSLLLLAVLYAVPINSKVSNLRNLAGLKVYIVCFCWATVTLIVPIVNAGLEVNFDIMIKFVQRFILVLILIGVFEIVDLQYDSDTLKTLPQTLGVTKTKWLLTLLLIPFFFIEFLKLGYQPIQAWNNLIIVILTTFFIWYASAKRSQIYSLFWVESVPIFWWFLVVAEHVFKL